MAVINLVGETFADVDHTANLAALRDLTGALARTAPRACAVRVLVPQQTDLPVPANPRIATAQVPLPSAALPVMWRVNAAARPLDGEMLHAITPLAPLRPAGQRGVGTQVSVAVPHLAFLQPQHGLTAAQAKQQRGFLKRAVKHASVLVAPNFAVASRLQAEFDVENVRVISNAAPQEYLAGADVADRRQRLWLPERYLVVTEPCAPERLEWLTAAVQADELLPSLVIVEPLTPGSELGATAQAVVSAVAAAGDDTAQHNDTAQHHNTAQHNDTAPAADTAQLLSAGSAAPGSTTPGSTTPGSTAGPAAARILRVQPTELADYGAIISGARALVLPHDDLTMAYEVYGAIAAGVPVLHAEIPAAAEITVDAGATFNSAEQLRELLTGLFHPAAVVASEADSDDLSTTEHSTTELSAANLSAANLSAADSASSKQTANNPPSSASDGSAPQLDNNTLAPAETPAYARLRVLAEDRSDVFTWDTTAAALWELHASL